MSKCVPIKIVCISLDLMSIMFELIHQTFSSWIHSQIFVLNPGNMENSDFCKAAIKYFSMALQICQKLDFLIVFVDL